MASLIKMLYYLVKVTAFQAETVAMETMKVDAYGIYKFCRYLYIYIATLFIYITLVCVCTSFKRLLLVNSEDIITGIVKVRLVWRQVLLAQKYADALTHFQQYMNIFNMHFQQYMQYMMQNNILNTFCFFLVLLVSQLIEIFK